jgi:hypothetical protein
VAGIARRSTASLEIMSMSTVVASIIVAVLVLLNLVATIFLVQSDFETALQKSIQLLLVWLIPCIGSIVVISVLKTARSDRRQRFHSDSGSDTTTWLAGIGPESESTSGHHPGNIDAGSDSGYGGNGGGH